MTDSSNKYKCFFIKSYYEDDFYLFIIINVFNWIKNIYENRLNKMNDKKCLYVIIKKVR